MKLVKRNTFKKKFLILIIVSLVFFFFAFSLTRGASCSNYKDESSCKAQNECTWDPSLSQCCPVTEISWPTSPGGTKLTGCSDIRMMVKYFYEWGITLGALAAFLMLIVGGFQYLTSVGEPAKIKEAKDRIISAVGGLILLLCTFIILNTLNPSLTTLEKPSTEIGSLLYGKFREIEKAEPCQWVILYRDRNYQKPYVIFFGENLSSEEKTKIKEEQKLPSDISEESLNDCKKTGDKGWWITGWGSWHKNILSVKVKGACQVNFYERENCTGGFSAVGKSVRDLSAYISVKRVYSIKPLDVAPPYPPEVENISFSVSGSSVTLKGKVKDLGNSDVAECFFEYGPQVEENVYDLNKTVVATPEEIYEEGIEFSAIITNLKPGKYGGRAVCSNEAGPGFAPEISSFKIE